ncbi:MAG TPA: DUF4252 domain-containing protein [Flavobacteriaceae bacterium]|nr:DUF4252 domain-containing protein [Flavobacteriaceae bacterium]
MKTTAKFLALAMIGMLISCSNNASLQKYFVEKLDDREFVTVDFAPGSLFDDAEGLSEENQKVLKTVKKINFLALQNEKTNPQKMASEKLRIKEILAQEKYQPLIKFGSNKQAISLYFTGNEEEIGEVIVYGNSENEGLGLVRVLGKDMNPSAILQLVMSLDEEKINLSVFEDIQSVLN